MNVVGFVAGCAYLAAAILFVTGLHRMRTPSTARSGNLVSAAGMAVTIVATAVVAISAGTGEIWGWSALAVGLAVGSVFGAVRARSTEMTDVPQFVSLLNAVGGGAAAAVALTDFLRRTGTATELTPTSTVPIALDVLIGGVTLSGSLIAAGKLQGIVSGAPIRLVGARVVNTVVAAGALIAGVLVVLVPATPIPVLVLLVAASALGVLMVLPIGGADAPVVVSLLNAFTGLAVAFAGFAIDNQAMIIAGALVGAAGTILTRQMAAAMNRSVLSIIVGGFGTGDEPTAAAAGEGADVAAVRQVTADDVGLQLAYARTVMVVPGYGLAAAQAQHEIAELATLLTDHGIAVTYAIHPVAGRMPGHMNVLLAEANVPYSQMLQLDQANAAFATCDVALVVGANDVTNPAARRPGNAVSGMPILDVDRAKAVVVVKRSMSPGYSGIPNELFTEAKTGMFFADAKQGLSAITAAVKQYVTA
ncbi:NAD(P)(+) transhydrogenase (Re/Si-specific) subunit beta [Curtobacterium sp. VKM Ac-1393]|uniref:NAD(P)(+) transhydrogenase (Re/Si-specific) subunit beta n=1 Tax=Curtobacterium sp. VKM Ac-1393 TaxID=2783814 RepID=UPI00188DAF36|nr:NAD(P)(+) transhydrogenase (Re/Si-specific) subunit beta [Curtobacterium sp. VKM Ac-1393]MBF4606899.1 NAD(P)(+) transhydrogenase (Re/Si-specific) subunit beta [Curtobacterium sp. VKM Ac-1393]